MAAADADGTEVPPPGPLESAATLQRATGSATAQRPRRSQAAVLMRTSAAAHDAPLVPSPPRAESATSARPRSSAAARTRQRSHPNLPGTRSLANSEENPLETRCLDTAKSLPSSPRPPSHAPGRRHPNPRRSSNFGSSASSTQDSPVVPRPSSRAKLKRPTDSHVPSQDIKPQPSSEEAQRSEAMLTPTSPADEEVATHLLSDDGMQADVDDEVDMEEHRAHARASAPAHTLRHTRTSLSPSTIAEHRVSAPFLRTSQAPSRGASSPHAVSPSETEHAPIHRPLSARGRRRVARSAIVSRREQEQHELATRGTTDDDETAAGEDSGTSWRHSSGDFAAILSRHQPRIQSSRMSNPTHSGGSIHSMSSIDSTPSRRNSLMDTARHSSRNLLDVAAPFSSTATSLPLITTRISNRMVTGIESPQRVSDSTFPEGLTPATEALEAELEMPGNALSFASYMHLEAVAFDSMDDVAQLLEDAQTQMVHENTHQGGQRERELRLLPPPRFYLGLRGSHHVVTSRSRLSRNALINYEVLFVPPDDCQVEEQSYRPVLCGASLALVAAYLTQQDRFSFCVDISMRECHPDQLATVLGPFGHIVPLGIQLPLHETFSDLFVEIGHQLESSWLLASCPTPRAIHPLVNNGLEFRYLTLAQADRLTLPSLGADPSMWLNLDEARHMTAGNVTLRPLPIATPVSHPASVRVTFWETMLDGEVAVMMDVSSRCTNDADGRRVVAETERLFHVVLREAAREPHVLLSKVKGRLHKAQLKARGRQAGAS
ncbi:uncharacterized protein MONBRDRAFT_9347 [Monosiga brevicollis MX1]|uniref:Uncharacterized protein n=1 Tax=Monosiga brevicollis TaxID=81824 RepID=A9V2V3_MONBE|nr:uncharacterized protein MONBRDRAFT_9347 [Monosiga brevicollis MX1]EDQ87951.1 predicted protein [Monosiga brevicollis MX1]|eukprot:XP_001747027.1 hypothetical protein [Monosiga brevicollis MX1]